MERLVEGIAQETLAFSGLIDTDLLKKFHRTARGTWGADYIVCDTEGHVLFHHRKQDSLSGLFVRNHQVKPMVLELVSGALHRRPGLRPHKVHLIPGSVSSVAVMLPGDGKNAGFVFSGPYVSQRPTNAQVDTCARTFGLTAARLRRAMEVQTDLATAEDLRRVGDFLLGVVSLGQHMYDERNPLNRSLSTLSALHIISGFMNSSLGLKEVLTQVLDNAMLLLGAESGSLMLLDEATQELQILVSNGLPGDVVQGTRVRLGEGISGRVAAEGKARLLLRGVADPSSTVRKHTDQLKSTVCVPMLARDRVIGVLNISGRRDGEDFDEHDLNLAGILGCQSAITIENSSLHEQLRDLFISSITALTNAIDARDPYTRGHSERVARYTVRLGERLGFAGNELEGLRYAALLHDVGKIHIHDGILNKPGRLTDEEFQIMKLHPIYGAEILRPIKAFEKILPFIYHHHERFCAVGGYPMGLAGDQIPFEARIICVADAYDAMTSTRPYRKALSVAEGLAELQRYSGTQFDPLVVEAFARLLDEDPNLARLGIEASLEAERSGWIPEWMSHAHAGPLG